MTRDFPGSILVPTGPGFLGYDLAKLPESTGVEKLVLKRGNLFAVTNRVGDIAPAGARDQGCYFGDTRFLSALKLDVAGGPAICLSSQTWSDALSQVDLTVTSHAYGGAFADPVNFIHLRREQMLDGGFVDRLTLTNFLTHGIVYWIELFFACDFADQFEVRGAARTRRGSYYEPRLTADCVAMYYNGTDHVLCRSEIAFHPRPTRLSAASARFEFQLAQGETKIIELSATPNEHLLGGNPSARARADERRRLAASPEMASHPESRGDAPAKGRPLPLPEEGWRFAAAGDTRAFEPSVRVQREAFAVWAAHCTQFDSPDEVFQTALAQGVADLKALSIEEDGYPIISAGIPWYTAPFGRDALIAAYEALLVSPEVAREALVFLAHHQGTVVDAFREEQPGKILHELRRGELARAGEVPHTPYYGSIDATPLFIILLSEYFKWTNDVTTVTTLLPHAEAALRWIETHGDFDGDGWVEYQRRTDKGLENQGWKDSSHGVPWPDGRPAAPPIALVEVQGYCADARRRLAQLWRRVGALQRPQAKLAESARQLTQRIDETFWVESAGCYALALDAEKRPVPTVTSNAGHLLFSRAVLEPRARRLADTLLDGGLFSGWGLRTLAKGQRAYNPLSYHNGTVWPHDNALIAMGLSHYGLGGHAVRIFEALHAAARHFRSGRLPELFCGLGRDEGAFPVSYPVACSPQAWASAAPFLLLRAVLGIYPDAPRRLLRIVEPRLPAFLSELKLRGLRIGESRVDLRFSRAGGGTFATVERIEGPPLAVRIDIAGV